MKNNIIVLSVLCLLSGCYQSNQVELNKSVLIESQRISDIKVSFRIKDANSVSRIKSVDAYLVKDPLKPLESNAYSSNYKYQADVINGVISFSFKNAPSGGPYYLALQAFDNTIAGLPRNNITEINNSILSTDKNVAISSNNVSINNNQLVFSDGGQSLNTIIGLTIFNNLGVTISPQKGDDKPDTGISVGG